GPDPVVVPDRGPARRLRPGRPAAAPLRRPRGPDGPGPGPHPARLPRRARARPADPAAAARGLLNPSRLALNPRDSRSWAGWICAGFVGREVPIDPVPARTLLGFRAEHELDPPSLRPRFVERFSRRRRHSDECGRRFARVPRVKIFAAIV